MLPRIHTFLAPAPADCDSGYFLTGASASSAASAGLTALLLPLLRLFPRLLLLLLWTLLLENPLAATPSSSIALMAAGE